MASKIIKGLTVEIGGDTTKLGKALDSVESKSRDLSSELGEINKLLKFDPGNADLLAQKQKVLADAVANTSKKLDTLKDAEKQVQEQFKRGEVSEEQVRALQREIVATEKKLGSYKNAAKETAEAVDKLGKESDDAAEEIEETADAANDAAEAGESLGAKLGSVAKTGFTAVTGAATALIGALVGCAEETREYRTEMGKLDTAFTTAGHTSEAATETYKSLQGVLGETEQAVEAANHLAQLCDTEEELAQWTDIATGVYATFGASLPIEGLTEAANETAKTGALTGGLADALNWAGVNEEAFQAKLDACSTEQERQALITETLNGLYSEAAEQYRETNAELIRANEANEAWTASMADAGAAVEPILTDVKLLGASLLDDMLPGVQQLTESFSGLLAGDDVITRISDLTGMTEESVRELKALGDETGYTSAEFQELASVLAEGDTTVQATITNLLSGSAGVGEALSGLITSLLDKVVELAPTVAEVALSLISTLLVTLLNSLPDIVGTLASIATQAISTLAALLPELLPAIVQAALGVVDQLLTALPELLTALVQVVEGVIAALPEIIQLLVDRIPEVLVTLFHTVIPSVIEAAVMLFSAILEAIPILIEALLPLLPSIVNVIIEGLIGFIPLLLEAAVQLLLAIVQAIPQFLPVLVQQLPTIITSITGTLLKNLPLLINAAVKLFFGILEAIPKIITELTRQMPTIISAIVKGLKQGVKNMAQVGTDLVKGLWNGIKDMTSWIIGKLQSFGDSVLGGIKDFFGIHSPSREMAWVGQMLDKGLVKGVEDYADEPLEAMADLSQGMLDEAENLNGVTINRQLSHSFTDPAGAQAESGILGKLDRILTAIEKGQVIALDGETLVGATLSTIDKKLGQQQLLTARGTF